MSIYFNSKFLKYKYSFFLNSYRLKEELYGQTPIFGVHFGSENQEKYVLIKVGDEITDEVQK